MKKTLKGMKLPSSTNVQVFKLRLPPKVLKAFKAFGGGERDMYICDTYGMGLMMSPQKAGTGKRRLFPVPPSVDTRDMMNWEVVG